MPPERVLPICPRAVATARPGREAWAREELEDALAADPGSIVVETGFRGVYAILSPLDPCRLARVLLEWEYSFVKTVVVADRCAPCSPRAVDVLSSVARACEGPVRVMARVRGRCKEAVDPEAPLRSMGVAVHRRSRAVYGVEGLGGWVLAVCGRARSRPYGAVFVAPGRCVVIR